MAKNPKAPASADPVDDLCKVVAALADGDSLNAPDVFPALLRIRQQRECERPVPGYPAASTFERPHNEEA